MSEFPFEIITEILSRVPVESLLRFRCVYKSWCSLIESLDFIKTHLNRSIENHTNLTLILREMGRHQNTLYSFDFYSPRTPIPLKNTLRTLMFLGSCNGLLLLKTRDHHQLVLLNPSTRHYRNVPSIPVTHYSLDDSVITRFEKYGLGYDSFNDDYKVIKVVEFYESHKWVKTKAKVDSLKSNLWREIGDFPYRLPDICENGWGAHVNDALHMVARKSYDFGSVKLIVAFDIVDVKFYLVPKPDFLDKKHVEMSGCFGWMPLFDGFLRGLYRCMDDEGLWSKGVLDQIVVYFVTGGWVLCFGASFWLFKKRR